MLLNEAILSRHSTRSFRPDPVDRALLFTLADAAQQAPSASNLQAWRFLFITDPQLKRKSRSFYVRGLFWQNRQSSLVVLLDDNGEGIKKGW